MPCWGVELQWEQKRFLLHWFCVPVIWTGAQWASVGTPHTGHVQGPLEQIPPCVMVTQHLPLHTRRPDLAQNVEMLKDHPLLSKQPTTAANLSQNMNAAVKPRRKHTRRRVGVSKLTKPVDRSTDSYFTRKRRNNDVCCTVVSNIHTYSFLSSFISAALYDVARCVHGLCLLVLSSPRVKLPFLWWALVKRSFISRWALGGASQWKIQRYSLLGLNKLYSSIVSSANK